MARTLPWLKDAPSTTSTSRTKSPASLPTKRPRANPPSGSDSDTPHHNVSRPPPPISTRPPSSSPPRASSPLPSPPLGEPLRPGLTADDIHIMVEDEFLSTARLFTSHLHRAEYRRLKNLTHSSPKPEPRTRPVDSVTEMRAEMKRQREAEAQARKVEKMMGNLNGAGGGKRKGFVNEDGSGSDSGNLEEEERGDEVGAGTVLRQLMKKSPGMNLGSLSGLQGVKSVTRAAKGYEPAEERRERDRGIKSQFARGNGGGRGEDEEDEETEQEDSDDLDRPATRKVVKKVGSTGRVELGKEYEEPRKRADSVRDMKPAQEARVVKPRVPTPSPSPPQIKRSPSPSLPRKSNAAALERIKARREQERKKEKGLAIDEIPLFLI